MKHINIMTHLIQKNRCNDEIAVHLQEKSTNSSPEETEMNTHNIPQHHEGRATTPNIYRSNLSSHATEHTVYFILTLQLIVLVMNWHIGLQTTTADLFQRREFIIKYLLIRHPRS